MSITKQDSRTSDPCNSGVLTLASVVETLEKPFTSLPVNTITGIAEDLL